MDKDILDAVQASVPQYNEYLLRTFMNEQVDGAADFIDIMFREAVKLFSGVITYRGYRVMSPEARAEYELQEHKGCRVTTSDLLLVEYVFVHAGIERFVPLYIPYLYNDVMRIEDTRYVLQRSVKEQAFSRVNHGVIMKVLRQPIPFYSIQPYRLDSVTDAWSSNETVPTTSVYRGARSAGGGKVPNTTIILYLLCKYGFIGTLARFELTPEDCAFTNLVLNTDTDVYRYFPAKFTKNRTQSVDIYLKVRKDRLYDPVITKLIASILYTLTQPFYQKHTVESLYDPSGMVFRIMLGKIANGANVNDIQAASKTITHISSVDSYLDPITQTRLQSYGIVVNDIYDVFQYVFCKIEQLTLVRHTDLYASRIDYLEDLLVDTIVRVVYGRWYDALKRLGSMDIDPSKYTDKEVKRILGIPPGLITKVYDSRVVQKNPPTHNDNALVSWFIQKIRQSGRSKSGRIIRSEDHRFDPSMLPVESVLAFSKTNPGAAGAINPYVKITPNGSINRAAMDYADEIDELAKYLP